jgi:hypothetical protein
LHAQWAIQFPKWLHAAYCISLPINLDFHHFASLITCCMQVLSSSCKSCHPILISLYYRSLPSPPGAHCF